MYDSIDMWIEATQQPDRKRKRAYPLSPDSHTSSKVNGNPPAQQMSEDVSTPLRKRQRRPSILQPDPDLTPTLNNRGYASQSSASSSPTKSQSSSIYSGRHSAASSSARQAFFQLPLADEGIKVCQLSDITTPGLPTTIRDILRKINAIQQCRGVLSSDLRGDPSIAQLVRTLELGDSVFANLEDPASSLTVTDVERIEANARRCFELHHDEPVWNVEVHQPLLSAVLRGDPDMDKKQLSNFSLCTTAAIIKEYLPASASNRKVDFCIYLNPSADTDRHIPSKIQALRQTLPETSLNHSSYGPLYSYPISVSLETKRSGHELDKASLQIGIWQAAQWKMLRKMLYRTAPDRLKHRKMAAATLEEVETYTTTSAEIEEYAKEELASLGALPGVLVQGHNWIFVATSPEFSTEEESTPSRRTVLWREKPIGDTRSKLGVHQVAAFIEYLNWWSTAVYWPWYKRCFLF